MLDLFHWGIFNLNLAFREMLFMEKLNSMLVVSSILPTASWKKWNTIKNKKNVFYNSANLQATTFCYFHSFSNELSLLFWIHNVISLKENSFGLEGNRQHSHHSTDIIMTGCRWWLTNSTILWAELTHVWNNKVDAFVQVLFSWQTRRQKWVYLPRYPVRNGLVFIYPVPPS